MASSDTKTATGRRRDQTPNLQNIPIRTKEGKRIRDAFRGHMTANTEYSQIEKHLLEDSKNNL